MNIDWDTYAETFPERYLRRGHFDGVVDFRLAQQQRVSPGGWNDDPLLISPEIRDITVLEIGGGTTGCHTLREAPARPRVWFLDPLVTGVPDWVVENLSWDSVVGRQLKFDFVIARGCINYLTQEEIRAIPDILAPGGLFLANTFGQVRDGDRNSTGRNGHMLQESIRWEHPNLVHHELTLPDGGVIKHSFFHYTQNQYLVFLGAVEGGCTFTPYGDNSLLIELRG